MLAEDYLAHIAHILFMHPEKLMVRICSCTFDISHVYYKFNVTKLCYILLENAFSICDSFWLLGTKVSPNINPLLHCPRFSFIQTSCIMNFVQIPDKVPCVSKLVKVCAAPCGTSKINFSHIWPLCRWNIIHALDFLSGVEQNLTFIRYNCICIFVLYMVQLPSEEDQKMPLKATQRASELIYTVTSVNFSLGPSCARIYMSFFLMTYQKVEPDCGRKCTIRMSLILSAIFPRNCVQWAFMSSRICNLHFNVHFAHMVNLFLNEFLKIRHRNAVVECVSVPTMNHKNFQDFIFLSYEVSWNFKNILKLTSISLPLLP